MRQSIKQNGTQNDTIFNSFTHGGVLELADRQDLGSCAERREGSSPSFPTTVCHDRATFISPASFYWGNNLQRFFTLRERIARQILFNITG